MSVDPRPQGPHGPVWRAGWPHIGTPRPCEDGNEEKLILSIRGYPLYYLFIKNCPALVHFSLQESTFATLIKQGAAFLLSEMEYVTTQPL